MSYNKENLGATMYIRYPNMGLTSGKNAYLYCFSNYYIEVYAVSVGVKTTLTINGVEFVRYTNVSGKAIFYITSDMLKPFFSGSELGEVDEGISINGVNDGSKLVKKGQQFKVEFGDKTWTKNYDILYGALQLGEGDRDDITIYKFGNLPLWITQMVGHWCTDKNDYLLESNSFGKDINVKEVINRSFPIPLLFKQQTPGTPGVNETVKTIYVKDMKSCGDGIYLRWISEHEGYKHFFFHKAEEAIAVDDRKEIEQRVLGDNDDMLVLKKQSRTFALSAVSQTEYSIKSADVEMQKFIFDLQHAIHVWAYIGRPNLHDRWQEVDVEVEPYTIDYKKSRKEISVKVLKNINTQSL